jgi:SAM-dependent MidA family methyltransferase
MFHAIYKKMSQSKLEILLKRKKEISFSDYMEFILFDKESGLYENHEILGKKDTLLHLL